MVVPHDTFPTNRFPTAVFSRLCSAAVRRSPAAVASLQMRTNLVFKHLQFDRTLHLAVEPLLFSGN